MSTKMQDSPYISSRLGLKKLPLAYNIQNTKVQNNNNKKNTKAVMKKIKSQTNAGPLE